MESLDEPFILKFEYKEKPHILEVRPWIQQYRTSYKVTVEEVEITYEADEEGLLRAIADTHASHHLDPQLIEDIGRRIVETVNGQ